MRPSAALAILALLPLSVAVADVYRSVDAQGHVLYSDTPSPGAELIRTGSTHWSSAAAAPTAKPAASGNAPAASTTEQQIAARAVQSDVAQTRADQCKKAQDAYQKSVQARRIYTEGPNGERQYLTDEQADQTRVANKMQMDEACKDAVSAQ